MSTLMQRPDQRNGPVFFFFGQKASPLRTPWWGIPLLLSYNAKGGGKADGFFHTFFQEDLSFFVYWVQEKLGASRFFTKKNGDLLGGRWAVVFVEEGAGPPRGFVAIQPGSPPTYLNPEEKAGLFVGFWVVYPGECILVNGFMTCSKGCDFEPMETTTPAPC